MTRLPLPEPGIRTAMVYPENEPRRLWGAYYTADQMHEYAAAVSAALQQQLDAARRIIVAQDERSTHHAREIGPLMQRAADVDGEREANALLTDEIDKLQAQVRVLREALTYHQDQTRPIERTRVALYLTK